MVVRRGHFAAWQAVSISDGCRLFDRSRFILCDSSRMIEAEHPPRFARRDAVGEIVVSDYILPTIVCVCVYIYAYI